MHQYHDAGCIRHGTSVHLLLNVRLRTDWPFVSHAMAMLRRQTDPQGYTLEWLGKCSSSAACSPG